MKLKQLLCLVLALMMCVSLLAGCGDSGMEATNPPASGGESGGNASSGNASSGDFTPSLTEGGLQITADCVFHDPADLDFDTCYPLYFGPTNEAVAMSADTGMQYYGIYSVSPGDLWIIHESPGFVVTATKNRIFSC